MSRNLKLILSSAIAAGLLVAGCGAAKQESVTVNLETFRTADGNIGCIADETMVRCDIKHKEWKAKPDPSCQLDYGNGLTLSEGQASLVCAGDTTLNSGPALTPGTVNLVGSFECSTNEWGDSIRCKNVKTGNGFDLSTDRYDTF